MLQQVHQFIDTLLVTPSEQIGEQFESLKLTDDIVSPRVEYSQFAVHEFDSFEEF